MEDSRPKVGLDVDGVLAAFSPRFIQMANEKYDLSLKLEDQTGWAHQSLGLNDHQADEIWREIEATKNWWLKLDKLPNTDELSNLVDRFRIYFITSRTLSAGFPIERQTAHWILKHYFIPFPTVIVSSHKGPLAAALNLDYFLDDRPENCADVATFNPYTEVFLQDAPYNQEFNARRVRRVRSVNEFFQAIQTGGVNGLDISERRSA